MDLTEVEISPLWLVAVFFFFLSQLGKENLRSLKITALAGI
jgi:hypothetical protein